MRIHLSAPTRHYTVLRDEVLRDPRLSFTARGILVYLLSLPDGSREDARTLADKHPKVGRRNISKALDELIEAGYYHRRTTRDPDTGRIRCWTYVTDTPIPAGSPLPMPPGSGEPAGPNPGAFPSGRNTGEDVPTPRGAGAVAAHAEDPPPAHDEPADPGDAPEPEALPDPGAAAQPKAGPAPEADPQITEAAAILAHITAAEPKLTLSPRETLTLAPLVIPWLERGCSRLVMLHALTSGLPERVNHPRGFLAHRLRDKLPAPRAHRDPAAPLPECAECRDPLPRNQHTGLCASCAGVAPAHVTDPSTQTANFAARVAALRDAVRERRALAAHTT
ncbi:hypothetical protein SRB5_62240 [Streptomyces sp. RB5]|uniref:Helix-turn-helix domain-containing protein n=1 Tax=Streptomyces smaragdinus TaxID=2585196 RepID=A0A7K0CSP6_9ACTN|nr:helix-turn-helix domain-containing protein [Streptomyces smaragdinus]MQY16032.1 hypothetical protein [Streptomyces smaragdinus]